MHVLYIYMHRVLYIYTQTHTYIYIHTHIHTYISIYIYTCIYTEEAEGAMQASMMVRLCTRRQRAASVFVLLY